MSKIHLGFAAFLRKAMQFDMFGRHVDMTKNPRGRKNYSTAGQIHLPTLRPPGAGWQPIPHSIKGGFRRRRGVKWEYWYPDGNHGTHAAPREPEPALEPESPNLQPAPPEQPKPQPEVETAPTSAALEKIKTKYGLSDEDAAAVARTADNMVRLGMHTDREQAMVAAGEAHAKKNGWEPAAAPMPAPKPEPEPRADVEPEAVASALQRAKSRAVAEIDRAANNPAVWHEDVGEHVWGSRKDTATPTGTATPKRSGGATKSEIFGDFTIHDHVAKGGTIGGWHLKQWVAGMIAAKAPDGLDEPYRAGCTVVAKALDRCLTVDDVKTAVAELADWGERRQYQGQDPPGDGYVKIGTGWDHTGFFSRWQERASGGQKGALGKRVLGVIYGTSPGYSSAQREARALERKGADTEAYIRAHARSQGFSLTSARTISRPSRVGGRMIAGVTDAAASGASVTRHFGGMKNIQYGDWMSQADRELHLKGAAGALADLADIIGVPDDAVSFGGQLSIGFGARGNGRGVAHYEPDGRIINMTKFRGGGSLAHEWGHFMDNMLGGGGEKFASASAGTRGGVVPKKTAEALDALTRAVRSSEFYADAKAMDEKKSRGYWSDSAELFARVFESWAQDKLASAGRTNTYLVHGTEGDGHSTGVMRTVMEVQKRPEGALTVDDAEKAVRAVLGRVIPKISPKAKPVFAFWGWTDAMVQRAVTQHPEAKDAMAAYWDARRGDKRVVKRVDGKPVTREAQPYPSGEERQRLHSLMDSFIASARADGVLTKVMKAFMRGRSVARGTGTGNLNTRRVSA